MTGDFNFSIVAIKHKGIDKDYTFWGSFYRGMLGRNLKRRFCILRNADCISCPVADKCLYMLSFEKYRDVLFPPYVINKATKDYVQLTLIGVFAQFAPIYIEAFKRELAIEQTGFYNPFKDSIVQDALLINSKEFGNISSLHNPLTLKVEFGRFKSNSKLIPDEELTFTDILKSVERRLYLVNKYFGNPSSKIYIDRIPQAKKLHSEFVIVKRYSNRKNKLMSIPTINAIFFIEDALDVYKYLKLASYLNIGTNASMGFGQLNVY